MDIDISSSSDDDAMLACVTTVIVGAVAAYSAEHKYTACTKRPWLAPMTKARQNRRGAYHTTIPLLITNDQDGELSFVNDNDVEDIDDVRATLPRNRVGTFRNYFRMDNTTFQELLEKVSPLIVKQDTNFRKAIPPEERLMVTLRYLATGCSFRDLHYDWKMGVSTIIGIVYETSEAIYSALSPDYVRTPSTPDGWIEISKQLEEMWNFPNAIGSLDGKHIVMAKPWSAGSQYHNYKGTESLVLMAMCDANYSFTYIDMGAQGRVSDGGVFDACSLNNALETETLNLPAPRTPVGGEIALPYVVLGDEAFPLRNNIMKPYARRQLDHDKRIFNYRLSRVRRLIENAFGILSGTWRIFRRPIDLQPEQVVAVTLACVALHNMLRAKNAPNRITTDNDDVQGNWRQLPTGALGNLPPRAIRPGQTASQIRDAYKTYFVSAAGSVAWQEHMITFNN